MSHPRRRLLKAKIGVLPPRTDNAKSDLTLLEHTAYMVERVFRAKAQLPKCYWFWAIRTAIQRMNMLPCRNPDSETDYDNHAGKSLPINNIPDEAGTCFLICLLGNLCS
jgi:hypothetical protein